MEVLQHHKYLLHVLTFGTELFNTPSTENWLSYDWCFRLQFCRVRLPIHWVNELTFPNLERKCSLAWHELTRLLPRGCRTTTSEYHILGLRILHFCGQLGLQTKYHPLTADQVKMDERCYRPWFCTVKAILGRGQPGTDEINFVMKCHCCRIDCSIDYRHPHVSR